MVMKDNPKIVDGAKILKSPDRIIHFYDIIFIDQLIRKQYPVVTEAVQALLNHVDLKNNTDLVVDGTGVGDAPVDYMRKEGLYPIPLIFTGGEQVHEVYSEIGQVFSKVPGKLQGARTLKEIHVPKTDLVKAGELLLQQGRVLVARGLRWGPELKKQLNHFRGEIGKKKKIMIFEADDENVHDDLVICYCMGAWWFTRHRKDERIQERPIVGAEEKAGDWNPYDFW